MNKLITLLMLLSILMNCTQKSDIANKFNCSKQIDNFDLKTMNDINNNYSLTFPTHWKSSLYYDDYQSDIYLADTTKNLTSTYIINVSNKKGVLLIDKNLKSKLINAISNENLQYIKSDSLTFLEIPSYYIHAEGVKNNYKYQQINILKSTKTNSFLDIKIELYGDKQVNERICEAIYFVGLIKEI